MTQRALAERMNVTPRNVTALIDALELTGFVTRTAHEIDRRAPILVLTAKGRQTAARLQSDMTTFATVLFGDMDPDDLATVMRVLERKGARLEALVWKE